jgi:hypothetical protein
MNEVGNRFQQFARHRQAGEPEYLTLWLKRRQSAA